MLNRITAVQVCDARDDDSSNAAGYITTGSTLSINFSLYRRPLILLYDYVKIPGR